MLRSARLNPAAMTSLKPRLILMIGFATMLPNIYEIPGSWILLCRLCCLWLPPALQRPAHQLYVPKTGVAREF